MKISNKCTKHSYALVKIQSSACIPMQSYSYNTSLATGFMSQCFYSQVSEMWAARTELGQYSITTSRVNGCWNFFPPKNREKICRRAGIAWLPLQRLRLLKFLSPCHYCLKTLFLLPPFFLSFRIWPQYFVVNIVNAIPCLGTGEDEIWMARKEKQSTQESIHRWSEHTTNGCLAWAHFSQTLLKVLHPTPKWLLALINWQNCQEFAALLCYYPGRQQWPHCIFEVFFIILDLRPHRDIKRLH